MRIKLPMSVPLWAEVIGYLLLAGLIWFLVTSGLHGIKTAIWGDPEVKRAQASTTVAVENTKAESNIADGTINATHERDVYREHVTDVVHETREKISEADHGQQMDPAIDAAVADGLCRVHDGLCRPGSPAPVQPLRRPVPRGD